MLGSGAISFDRCHEKYESLTNLKRTENSLRPELHTAAEIFRDEN